jgi:hypothetical protein
MNPFPRLRKIIDEADRQKINELFRQAGENPAHVTHFWERGGEIIGACSLGKIPILIGWHRPANISPRDSCHMLRVYETVFAERGVDYFWAMVNKNSPYHENMEHFGYKSIWTTDVFEMGTGIKDPISNEPLPPAIEVPRMR